MYEGLKVKYEVFKKDTMETVHGCFVLRPDKDKSAIAALKAYAESTENKTLRDDIREWLVVLGDSNKEEDTDPLKKEIEKLKERLLDTEIALQRQALLNNNLIKGKNMEIVCQNNKIIELNNTILDLLKKQRDSNKANFFLSFLLFLSVILFGIVIPGIR